MEGAECAFFFVFVGVYGLGLAGKNFLEREGDGEDEKEEREEGGDRREAREERLSVECLKAEGSGLGLDKVAGCLVEGEDEMEDTGGERERGDTKEDDKVVEGGLKQTGVEVEGSVRGAHGEEGVGGITDVSSMLEESSADKEGEEGKDNGEEGKEEEE